MFIRRAETRSGQRAAPFCAGELSKICRSSRIPTYSRVESFSRAEGVRQKSRGPDRGRGRGNGPPTPRARTASGDSLEPLPRVGEYRRGSFPRLSAIVCDIHLLSTANRSCRFSPPRKKANRTRVVSRRSSKARQQASSDVEKGPARGRDREDGNDERRGVSAPPSLRRHLRRSLSLAFPHAQPRRVTFFLPTV